MLELEFSKKGDSDLIGILDYHCIYSVNSAKQVYLELENSFETLLEFPKFGKKCNNNKFFRELVCGNYIIYYKIKTDFIEIHRIIDSRVNFRI